MASNMWNDFGRYKRGVVISEGRFKRTLLYRILQKIQEVKIDVHPPKKNQFLLIILGI